MKAAEVGFYEWQKRFSSEQKCMIIWPKFVGLVGFSARTVDMITVGILHHRDAMSARVAIANQR